MASEARARINEHRLFRGRVADDTSDVSNDTSTEVYNSADFVRENFRKATLLHVVVFVLSFIFTTGSAVLGVLLWVRPGSLIALVLVGLLAGLIFVTAFASIRTVALKHLIVLHKIEESDEKENHLAKGIVYGLLAFVLALLIAGLLIKFASAFS